MNCVMESLLVVLQDRNFLKKIFTQSGVYLRNRKLRTQNVRERKKTLHTITLYCCFQGRKQRVWENNLLHFLFAVAGIMRLFRDNYNYITIL